MIAMSLSISASREVPARSVVGLECGLFGALQMLGMTTESGRKGKIKYVPITYGGSENWIEDEASCFVQIRKGSANKHNYSR